MGASKNTPSSNKKEEKRREWTDKNEQVKFVCGKSDGSGLQSDLYKAFSELNRLIQTLSSK